MDLTKGSIPVLTALALCGVIFLAGEAWSQLAWRLRSTEGRISEVEPVVRDLRLSDARQEVHLVAIEQRLGEIKALLEAQGARRSGKEQCGAN